MSLVTEIHWFQVILPSDSWSDWPVSWGHLERLWGVWSSYLCCFCVPAGLQGCSPWLCPHRALWGLWPLVVRSTQAPVPPPISDVLHPLKLWRDSFCPHPLLCHSQPFYGSLGEWSRQGSPPLWDPPNYGSSTGFKFRPRIQSVAGANRRRLKS